MDTLIRLFIGTENAGVAFAVNALMSLICLVWVIGAERTHRNRMAWTGWIIFWIGTAAYYVALSASDNWRHWPAPLVGTYWWVPSIGNYLATGSLLASYAMSERGGTTELMRVRRRILLVTVAVVFVSVVLDLSTHAWTVGSLAGPRTGWHQALACIAIAQWAWRLRTRDMGKSIILLIYAIVQLPLQPIFELLHLETNVTYGNFVVSALGVYAILKLSLLGPIYLAIEDRRPAADPP